MFLLLKTGNSAFSVPSLILCEVGLYALNVYILFTDIYTWGIMPLNTQNLTGREDLKSIYDFNRYLSVVWGGREGDCNVAVSLAITEPQWRGCPGWLSVWIS